MKEDKTLLFKEHFLSSCLESSVLQFISRYISVEIQKEDILVLDLLEITSVTKGRESETETIAPMHY